MKFTARLRGTTPLVMHNGRLVNPLDPIVKDIKKITAKRKKTDDDHEAIARLEHRASLYLDPDVGPFIPGENIHRMLVDAGKPVKLGKRVTEAVLITSDVNPIAYSGPRDADGLFGDRNYVLMVPVRVGTARTMRCRPIFPVWSCEATGFLDESLMDFGDLKQLAETGGAAIGLGDWRPRYGRFEVVLKAG